MSQKISKKLLFLFFLAIFWGIGFFSAEHYSSRANVARTERQEELRVKNFDESKPLINPLLQCDTIENVSNRQLYSIKSDVEGLINKEIKNKNIAFASIYFRDLNNGPWFGINEREKFIPGSLLKMPFMISIYKIAEDNPHILKNSVLYESGEDSTLQYFEPSTVINKGEIYSVETLVERMIKYSDNNAALLLAQIFDQKTIENTYADLGINPPKDSGYEIFVRDYASFFRILFNATYLSKNFSQKALKILSESKFDQGIRAGVPSGVVVAHKFGERETGDALAPKQLHDCGIVYATNKPYVLCVMTRGFNYERLSEFIRGVSKIVYSKI